MVDLLQVVKRTNSPLIPQQMASTAGHGLLHPLRYHDTVLPKGALFWYKGDDGLWRLGKISASTTESKVYLVRFLVWTTRDRSNFLFPRRATRLETHWGCELASTTTRIKIDGLSASPGRFVARVSASVANTEDCTGRGSISPAADTVSKWTSTSAAPTSCVIGPEPRTSTAKSTASTAECGSGRHSANSPVTTGNVS